MENKKKEAPKSRIMTLTVKAVVLNEKNEVLVLKRSQDNKFNLGKHDLPGGHVEENEGLKDTIIREIKEETGLNVVFGEIIDVVEFPKDNPLFKEEKRGIRCACYAKSGEVKLSKEHEKYEWVAIEKAADKFSEKDGFENEKRETVLKAKKYLEMKDSLNGWKRCQADFENYKKRQQESLKDTISYANSNLILEILPVLDNFHASTDHIPKEQKDSPWVVGIRHIQAQLEKILEDNGAVEVGVKEGDKFDPEIMEAISDANNANEHANDAKDRVKKVLMKGYKMGGKVIRATKVEVE